MEVLLLGTGSADGWPNAFCRCGSCAAQRAAGMLRLPTAALVDGCILLDLGAHVTHAAQAAGADLAELAAVFVTHAHSDHCDPARLFYWQWVNGSPLQVYGPAPVIEMIRPWLDPVGSPVRLCPVAAGDVIEVPGSDGGRYVVRVLPADHHAFGDAVLYDVTGPGRSSDLSGPRLLYATDTGPWTPRCRELLGRGFEATGRAYDVVLLEETFGDRPAEPGHHNLASFAQALDDLRGLGVVDTNTQVIAVHLSHHNPPEPELQARLAQLGARAGRDLKVETAPTTGSE